MKTAAFFAAMILLVGCEKRGDFFFITSSGREVTIDTPIMWHNVRIGRVIQIRTVNDQVQVDISLSDQFKHRLHQGAMIRLATQFTTGKPIVNVEKGNDDSAPLLKPRAQIPEAEPLVNPDALKPLLALLAPRVQHQLFWLIDQINSPDGQATVEEIMATIHKIREADQQRSGVGVPDSVLSDLAAAATRKFKNTLQERANEAREKAEPGPNPR